MKFRINTTGSIVEPNDETVLEQMKNSPFYTAIPDVEPDAQEGDNEGVKPLSKMNKDELLAAAQAAGIDVPDGSTKAEIVELIQATEAAGERWWKRASTDFVFPGQPDSP